MRAKANTALASDGAGALQELVNRRETALPSHSPRKRVVLTRTEWESTNHNLISNNEILYLGFLSSSLVPIRDKGDLEKNGSLFI